MRRYLGIGLTVLLIMAALFMPDWWFALRDAASRNRVQGENLAPLMVAQLDRSYENDIHARLNAYFEAGSMGDVICSSKKIDTGSETLWENLGQAQQSLLMQMLQGNGYLSPYGEKWGYAIDVESCTQYVLIRESDGQILLVANDIHLYGENDRHMELLLDGLDGTVYYVESEEDLAIPLERWAGEEGWELWYVLSENYHASYTEEEVVEVDAYIDINTDTDMVISASGTKMETFSDVGNKAPREYFADVQWIQIFDTQNSWSAGWENREVYCCQLDYGTVSDCWSLETEETENGFYRIRLGFPRVVNFIPEMAERIELAEFSQIYSFQY